MILEKIGKRTLQLLKEDLKIIDYSFAIPYTYVVIEGKKKKSIGVAVTLVEEIHSFENSVSNISLESFLQGAESFNIIERTLSLATINAISQYYIDLSDEVDSDVIRLLGRETNVEKVAVIGSMFPIVKKLQEIGKKVFVFERNKVLFDKITISDGLEYQLLPKMDAILATGAVLLNGTVDLILDRANNAKVVALLGPTAQALPELFSDEHITYLCSSKVEDIDNALMNLKLGSFKGSGKYNRRYALKIKN